MPNRIVKNLSGISFTIADQEAWAACDSMVVTMQELYGLSDGDLVLKIKLPPTGYDHIDQDGVRACGLSIRFRCDGDNVPSIRKAQEVHIINGKRSVN